ncbi:MAG: phosphoribosylamine--glycine ligase [Bacteroidetes bacterium]|nr:phosphoribosylamine--glycine ligase [Bacteroidota bacterium]
MNVLILGSGGREHALAWKISQSNLLSQLFIAPGNGGTSSLGTNVDIQVGEFDKIRKFVVENQIEMVVVGPEDPLVNGIHDYFLEHEDIQHVHVIGPQKEGAQLEGSKEYSKNFMKRHGIPTAAYQGFTAENIEEGYKFLESLSAPYVLKADGLAAGKGVLIISELEEAKVELRNMLESRKFGDASDKVVIEEFLNGIELSVFVLTDGNGYKILPSAKDYKRIGEGDTGLNTGGMGAVSPVPFLNEELEKKIKERIVIPSVEGLKEEGIPFKGFLVIGLMVVGDDPFVIEYNVRLGDPETEVVLPRIKSYLLALFKSVGEGVIDEEEVEVVSETATTVMLVSGGYPGDYEKNIEITGAEQEGNSLIFHAGTRRDNGSLLTNGGRVIAITSYGANHTDALEKSYLVASTINFEAKYYRKDIGFDL